MRDGSKQTDVLEQVWIAYEGGDKPALRELVGRFCSWPGQEMMYLEFADSLIEFIPPHEEGSADE
jgi:hypothetical protein